MISVVRREWAVQVYNQKSKFKENSEVFYGNYRVRHVTTLYLPSNGLYVLLFGLLTRDR
jgi:hypothetical protein